MVGGGTFMQPNIGNNRYKLFKVTYVFVQINLRLNFPHFWETSLRLRRTVLCHEGIFARHAVGQLGILQRFHRHLAGRHLPLRAYRAQYVKRFGMPLTHLNVFQIMISPL